MDEGCTCALTDGERIVTSRERGVRPLVELIASGADYNGWHAADKIVGKAAAYEKICAALERLRREATETPQ